MWRSWGPRHRFGAHIVRQFVDLGRVRKTSVAVLFVDVVGAFASVVREIVIGRLTDASQVAKICAKLRLEQSLGQEVVNLARRGGVLSDAGASPHLAALIREAHRNTWFAIEGLDTIVKISAGTKAGDPLADLVFNLLMAAILRDLRGRLRQEKLMTTVPYLDHTEDGMTMVEAFDVSYVDDAALLIESDLAEDLGEKVARSAALVVDVFQDHGLVVNMSPGKTEAIVEWRGRGSRAAKRRIIVDNASQIEISPAKGPAQMLKVTEAYKHLGGRVAADGDMRAEITSRIQSGDAVFRELRRPVFKDSRLRLGTRSQLASSLIDTRLLHNTATWPGIRDKDMSRLEVARARPHRAMLRLELRPNAPLVSSKDVLQCNRAMTTKRCITIARLRYLPRFKRSAPLLLLALVMATAEDTQSWLEAVLDDLAWLQNLVGDEYREVRPFAGFEQWMNFAADSLPRWRAILKRAAALDVQLADASIQFQNGNVAARLPNETHICAECGASFGSSASLDAHFARAHVSSIARRYAEGDVCRGCLKRFTSRDHVIHHLAVSKRHCLELLKVRCQPLTADRAAELDKVECARRRAVRSVGGAPRGASWPAHRVQGPLLRPLPAPGLNLA